MRREPNWFDGLVVLGIIATLCALGWCLVTAFVIVWATAPGVAAVLTLYAVLLVLWGWRR